MLAYFVVRLFSWLVYLDLIDGVGDYFSSHSINDFFTGSLEKHLKYNYMTLVMESSGLYISHSVLQSGPTSGHIVY